MNQWYPITNTAISNYVSKAQLQALCQHENLLESITADITASIRSHIRSNPNNSLHPDPTLIPHELLTAAAHLSIESLQSRIPTLKLSKDQIHNANNARKLLHRVATGIIKINTHPTPITVAKKRTNTLNSNNLSSL